MGRLTRDPEVRYSSGNPPVAIAKYSLAVDRKFKKEGQQDVDFINCRVLGKGGEFAEKYLKKGMLISVCGRLEVSNYEDKSGQKRIWTDVLVEEQNFAESKQAFESRMASRPNDFSGGYSGANNSGPEPSGFMPIEESVDDDDLPF